ncbi:MAG: HepT-like ribonuclease domain-containing protein [archaeon]
MLRSKLYFSQILRMINLIEKHREDGLDDEQNWDATLMRLQVIGENIGKIPMGVRKRYPDIEWDKFKNLRNIISHVYIGVLKEVVKDTIENKLPRLGIEIKNIMEKLNEK